MPCQFCQHSPDIYWEYEKEIILCLLITGEYSLLIKKFESVKLFSYILFQKLHLKNRDFLWFCVCVLKHFINLLFLINV